MKITIVSSLERFRQLEGQWNQLLNNSQIVSPFLTWQWMFSWWNNYQDNYSGDTGLFIITAFKKDDQLIFILPLFIRKNSRYGISYTQLKYLGTDYESSDYLDIICNSDFTINNFEALFQDEGIQNKLRSVDILTFNNLKLDSLLYRFQNGNISQTATGPFLKTTSTCPYLPLPESEEILFKSISKNMKSSLRRTRNKIKKDTNFKIYCVEDSSELADLIRTLFDLHHLRFADQNKKTKFIYDVRGVFHTEMARYFLERGILKLFVIKHAGTAIGILYCLEYQKRLMYVQAGFNPDFSKYALGNQLILFAINYAMGQDCIEFDFMRGSESYKYKWTDEARFLYQIEYAYSFKGLLLLHIEKQIRRLKSIAKRIIRKEK